MLNDNKDRFKRVIKKQCKLEKDATNILKSLMNKLCQSDRGYK